MTAYSPKRHRQSRLKGGAEKRGKKTNAGKKRWEEMQARAIGCVYISPRLESALSQLRSKDRVRFVSYTRPKKEYHKLG